MFIDAKSAGGTIYVSERDNSGKLIINTAPTPYYAYYDDELGHLRSITGQRIKRLGPFKSKKALQQAIEKEKAKGKRIWESDINPTFRYLEDKYPNDDQLPDLHISIYDIEVDRDKERGYATTDNPFCPIISFTIYHKWLKWAITVALPPPDMPMDKAHKLCAEQNHPDGYGPLDEDHGYYLVDDEVQLLEIFAELIQDSDVITGWNNEFYDLPYIINRARHVIGGESLDFIKNDTDFLPTERSREYLVKLSAFGMLPDLNIVESYGRKERTYQILGRRNADYLVFYKKFIKAELHSFALDAILQYEVKQSKVKYDGSIDEFYRREFRRFLVYNRQDVMGLDAIDEKRRLINMANQMIHMSGVTLDKAVGSVAIIEQAVLRELHRSRNQIAWDRVEHEPDRYVPGAFVVEPDAGLYGWGGSYDVNSLYPTMIRLLNISPETVIGQLDLTRTVEKLDEYVDDFLRIPVEDRRHDDPHHSYRHRAQDAIGKAYTAAWHQFTGVLEYHDVIEGSNNFVKLVTDTEVISMTGHDMRELILDSNWCITANGTVFDLTTEGIIPFCLTKWYNERAEYRKKAYKLKDEALEAQKAGDTAKAEELTKQSEFYDQVQNAKKLFLNSTYGAYLNRFFRFYDSRCGRSVTLSGRVVVKHMCRKSCELLAGEYDFNRDVILGGDTDSAYISYEKFLNENGIEKTMDNVVELGEWLGEQINASFVDHLAEQFLVPKERCNMVQVKRETTFDRAIFKDKKKRYALHVVDLEGARIPKGDKAELKIVGMEVKRSDTPKMMQDFLQECLRLVLVEGYGEEQLRSYVDDFRCEFRLMPAWKHGTPVRVSNLFRSEIAFTEYDRAQDEQEDAKKPQFHYAVIAARNTNMLMSKFKEQRWELLKDGDKVDVLYLTPKNEYGIDSVAIRVGEGHIPEWFQDLPFDTEAHEKKLIDQKLDNVFGSLNWDFSARDHDGWSLFS